MTIAGIDPEGELPGEATEPPEGGGADVDEGVRPPPTGGRLCAEPGCENFLPDNAAPARKYCDEHFRGQGGRAKRARDGSTGERAPKLVVEVGGKRPVGGKGDQRARDTAAGATAFLNVVAAGMAASGDVICAGAIAGGAAAWGQSVGELSKYQPWLQSFFAPVGGESQLGAWLGFLMATGAIALPVLAHHNLLPDTIGAKLGGVMVAANDVAGDDAA